jgi:hypothetical protein
VLPFPIKRFEIPWPYSWKTTSPSSELSRSGLSAGKNEQYSHAEH